MGLYEHLHDGEACQLSWPRRVKIALSIACVRRHLHTELHSPFVVAVLTSSSVYLAEDFTPKIVGFERWGVLFAKLFISCGVVVVKKYVVLLNKVLIISVIGNKAFICEM